MQECPSCGKKGVPSLFKLTAVPGLRQSCLLCGALWEPCGRAWISWGALVGPGLLGGILSFYGDAGGPGSAASATAARWLVAVGLLAGIGLYILLQIRWVRPVRPPPGSNDVNVP